MKIETLCTRAGYHPNDGEGTIPAIHPETTYKWEDTADVAKLFALEKEGFFYSRIANPTVDVLEKKIAALEDESGNAKAVCVSSGQAAVMLSILNICNAGDHIVASAGLYGGTVNLLSHTLKRFGITVTFVSPHATVSDITEAVRPNTKVLYAESVSNPSCEILNFTEFATVAKANHLCFIVDNTLATPYGCRPFELGANVVVHSTTKYLDGHACAVGGAVVDNGSWTPDKERNSEWFEPDESYNGMIFPNPFNYIFKLRVCMLRDFGCSMAPQNAWNTIMGIDTLAVRMRKVEENVLKIEGWFDFLGLKYKHTRGAYNSHYLKHHSGMISLVLDSSEQARKFLGSLKLITQAVHVADLRSMALHPASATHAQLSDEQLEAAGIEPGLVRISIGIEDAEDLIKDIEKALIKADVI